jgi:glyoxylase-like metal-dependent hydrolase (beta-lactamase superfamily II)
MKLDFAVGDMTVHRIVDLEAPFLHALEMLPALTPELLEENRHWLQPNSLDENDVFKLCYQAYLVRTPHHNILVDSCLGNHKPRARPEWHMKANDDFMRGLARVCLTPADIDFVMCTHLHLDHIGWNTQLVDGEWVPTFPRARYVFSRREVDATVALDAARPNAAYHDSVLPVIREGRAELVGDDYALGDHLRLLPTPGHTEAVPGAELRARHGSGTGRENAAGVPGAVLRHTHPVLYGALPAALSRPCQTVGRRLPPRLRRLTQKLVECAQTPPRRSGWHEAFVTSP